MAAVLIIWEEIPEETKFFRLTLEKGELEKALKAHGVFLNTDEETDDVRFVEGLLYDDEGLLKVDELAKAKDEAIDVRKSKIDYVICCGIVL